VPFLHGLPRFFYLILHYKNIASYLCKDSGRVKQFINSWKVGGNENHHHWNRSNVGDFLLILYYQLDNIIEMGYNNRRQEEGH